MSSFFDFDPPEALYGEFVFVEAAKTMTHQLKPQLHIISTELAPPVAECSTFIASTADHTFTWKSRTSNQVLNHFGIRFFLKRGKQSFGAPV